MEEEEVVSVKALLNLAVMQLEDARSKLSTSNDPKEAAANLRVLREVAVAAGVLEYLGTVAFGFPMHSDERFGLPGYWVQSKLEGVNMAAEFSTNFPAVMYNSVDVSLHSSYPDSHSQTAGLITGPVRVMLFDIFGNGRALNPTKILFNYECDEPAQAHWLGMWRSCDGVFVDAVELSPSLNLEGQGSFIVNPGGLMLE